MEDWKALIKELVSKGIKQSDIAASVPCAPSTISDIARGTTNDPGWRVASALKELQRKVSRRKVREKAGA